MSDASEEGWPGAAGEGMRGSAPAGGSRRGAGDGEVSPRGRETPIPAPDQELLGVPPEELPRQQVCFIAYGNGKHAKWEREWCARESAAANADRRTDGAGLTSRGAPPNLRRAEARVLQAPACLAKPVTQKKPFHTPFKIRLDLWYTGRLQLPVKVEAIALPESNVEHLAKQQGEGALVPTQLLQQNELENATICSCIQTHDGDDGAACEKRHCEDLEFTELRFSKSSRMNRRWILFTCRLGWDMLYVLYRLQTIVLSRRTDQYDKACALLRQRNVIGSMIGDRHVQRPRAARSLDVGDQGPGTPRIGIASAVGMSVSGRGNAAPLVAYIDQGTVRQFIHDKYTDSGLRRPLTDSDLAALDIKAGIHNTESGCVVEVPKWREFQAWFAAGLKSLKAVEHLWCSQGVMQICPFAINREVSERILQDRPLGTFVVRLCSQPGAFAISTKISVDGLSSEVNHVLVDALDLKAQPLETWVLGNEWAKNVLDLCTGEYVSKWMAFGPQVLTPVSNSTSDLSSPVCVTGPLATCSPLSCSTTMDPGTPTLSIDRAASEETTLSHTMMASLLSQPPLQQQQQPLLRQPSPPPMQRQHQTPVQQPSPRQLQQQQLQEELHQHLQQLQQQQQHQQLQQQQQQMQPQVVHQPQVRSVPCAQPYALEDFRGFRQLAEVTAMRPRLLAEAQILGKRSSSTSVGTTMLFGDRPYKRRLLGLQDGALYSMQRNLGAINQIEHCNV